MISQIGVVLYFILTEKTQFNLKACASLVNTQLPSGFIKYLS